MRLFGWVQNKLIGKQDNKRPKTPTSNTKHEAREEFSDWPQGLLSIGTFGNGDIKAIAEENPSRSCDELELPDITPEEVGELQRELTKLLSRNKPNKAKETADLPLDRFLNCPSSLELDRSDNSEDNSGEEDMEKAISGDQCKEVVKNKKCVGKRWICFQLKKLFVCWSGSLPDSIFRDTLQHSRMEKLLRTVLQKNLSSQSSYGASLGKKYLDKITSEKKEDQDYHDHRTDGGKWDKTDSEFIVLEI